MDSYYQIREKRERGRVDEDVEKLELFCTFSGNTKWYSHYGKQYGSFSKSKHRITIRSSNSTSGYIFKNIESKISKRYLHSHIHSSIIYNSQDIKATKMPINKLMDKQNMVYIHTVDTWKEKR